MPTLSQLMRAGKFGGNMFTNDLSAPKTPGASGPKFGDAAMTGGVGAAGVPMPGVDTYAPLSGIGGIKPAPLSTPTNTAGMPPPGAGGMYYPPNGNAVASVMPPPPGGAPPYVADPPPMGSNPGAYGTGWAMPNQAAAPGIAPGSLGNSAYEKNMMANMNVPLGPGGRGWMLDPATGTLKPRGAVAGQGGYTDRLAENNRLREAGQLPWQQNNRDDGTSGGGNRMNLGGPSGQQPMGGPAPNYNSLEYLQSQYGGDTRSYLQNQIEGLQSQVANMGAGGGPFQSSNAAQQKLEQYQQYLAQLNGGGFPR